MLTLAQDTLVRRESFGCTAGNLLYEGRFPGYASGVYEILQLLRQPISKTNLLKKLRKSFTVSSRDFTSLLRLLIDRKIVVESSSPQDHLFYFNDEKELPGNYLVSPISVVLYLTKKCPKTCGHCVTFSSPRVHTNGELSTEQWAQVLQKLRNAGVGRIVFTGGEPLIRRDFFEILAAANQMRFSVTINTDFDGVNQAIIDRLKSTKYLGCLQLSLDGATMETHDWLRGRGAFDKNMARLRLLQGSGMYFTVSSAISKKNLHEVQALAQIAQKHGARHFYVKPLSPYGRGEGMTQFLLDDTELWLLGQSYLQVHKEMGFGADNQFWWENIGKMGDREFHPFQNGPEKVSLGIYALSIGPNGFVYPDSKFKAKDSFGLGSVLERDFLELWNDPRWDILRRNFHFGESAFKEESLIFHED